eukprot:Protomagalhaensia_sp_Gyna_25__400@NODE_118_length_5105_cov_114_513028_g92_i0_p3_GENE_NODE_118_length_5105_cov_114_513028_g92_i0NODE_118_length_5105_cov_114_513028_g92_i0_p3_ORF_typecomplete_len242_score63_38Sec66/PF09802_9/1_3e17_NODE_118_length_5105_cov_114_513028_g92_i04271152
MEPWMVVCILLLLGAITYFIYRNALTNHLKQLENDRFMQEAADMMGFQVNFSGKDDYETKLRAIFDEYKGPKNWNEDTFHQDSLLTDPVEAWQRRLPDERIRTLKAQLIKRMVALLHQIAPFQQELQVRFVMFQRGLISEKEWKQFSEAQQTVDQELLLIKFEAECLQENFGNEGVIFKEASKFYQHAVQKKKMEANRAKLEELVKKFGPGALGPGGVPPPQILQAMAQAQAHAQRVRLYT